jgi:predicted glycogen debranching enzyme
MLAVHKASGQGLFHVSILGKSVEELLSRQWLLTNQRGSYASGTLAGCNTSGYHGLLIASLSPLVNRVMALSSCLETLVCGNQVFQLPTFDFGDNLVPAGHAHLREFWRDTGVHFLYHVDPVEVHKAIYLARESDTVLVEYTFRHVRGDVEFLLRPFVGLRDFHGVARSHAGLACSGFENSALVRREGAEGELFLACPAMRFENDPQWWYNFTYRANRARGHGCVEDLWTPGCFRARARSNDRIAFQARFAQRFGPDDELLADAEAIKNDLIEHQSGLIRLAGAKSDIDKVLSPAADQFIVRRTAPGMSRTTIVAGFPWFADWGRDSFVSLPGLLLATGRHDEAKSVLSTFAAACDRGMIPNHFDDHTGMAHFNSIDASLWFIHAAFEYLEASRDLATFSREFVPVIRMILDAYHNGTRFGIHADNDGLITGGDSNTQLTWMDAKCDGVAFTPRYGKAVEVNALWHNALCRMRQFCEQQALPDAGRYARMAARVGESFARVFWNETCGYLNDTVMPDGSVDASLRPNQILAVSLPYGPPLTRTQQQAIVGIIENELLTPCGLRTLDRQHPGYHARYEGSPRQRDEAYHQGTVWPWLIGPFVEAYLRVHDFSAESRRKARQLLEPLTHHLLEEGCLGSVCEIFDADPPQRPAGCLAQAWSVAELIRARHMARA